MLKKLTFLLLAILMATIIAFIGVINWINPNDYRAFLEKQVKQHTGLKLTISGEIAWQFYPHFGFTIGQTSLSNPAFAAHPALVDFDLAQLQIAIMPLFDKHLVIEQVSLEGADIQLFKQADGMTNIDSALSQVQAKAQPNSETPPAPVNEHPDQSTGSAAAEPLAGWQVGLTGLAIESAHFRWIDQATQQELTLQEMTLRISHFALQAWTPVEFAVQGKFQQQHFSVQANLQIWLDSAHLTTPKLQQIQLNASYADPQVQLPAISLQADQFGFDQDNAFLLQLTGKKAPFNIQGKLPFTINLDAQLQQIQLDAKALALSLTRQDNPQAKLSLQANWQSHIDVAKKHVALSLTRLQLNQTKLSGSLDISAANRPQISFKLNSPLIDLNQIQQQLATAQGSSADSPAASPSATANSQKPLPAVEPDLSALKALDVNGKINISKLFAQKFKVENIQVDLSLQQGVATLKKFKAQLYEGIIDMTAKLDARKTVARYQGKGMLAHIQLEPLLTAISDSNPIAGKGDIRFSLVGKSLIPDAIKQNLSGQIDAKMTDGAFHNMDIGGAISKAYDKHIHQQKSTASAKDGTTFGTAHIVIKIAKAMARFNTIDAKLPLFRLNGSGVADLNNETLNVNLNSSIVKSKTGQGGRMSKDLDGITIPVHIHGPFATPTVEIIYDQLMKNIRHTASKKAKERFKAKRPKIDKKIENKVDKWLGDKVDKKHQKQITEGIGSLLDGVFK